MFNKLSLYFGSEIDAVFYIYYCNKDYLLREGNSFPSFYIFLWTLFIFILAIDMNDCKSINVSSLFNVHIDRINSE